MVLLILERFLADIAQIWDLYEDKHLFNTIDPQENKYAAAVHLAEMVSYLGKPPPEFLKRSKISSWYFDDQGMCVESLFRILYYKICIACMYKLYTWTRLLCKYRNTYGNNGQGTTMKT